MRISPSVVLLLSLGLLPACGDASSFDDTGSDLAALSQIPSSQTDTAVLGQAYHTERKKVLNLNCVDGTSELRGNSMSTLSYEKDQSFDSVLKTLNGGLSVGLKIPVVSVNASADLATKLASTELSETHNLVWVGDAQKQVFVPNSLRLSERGTYYAQTRTDLIEDRCGNEFIAEVHRGASFLATLKLEFFNSEDRLEVGGKIKVNVMANLVDVEGNLRYIDENKKRRTKVSVYVVQRGGRPERLMTIIPDNVMYCTLEDPAPCLDVFRNLIRYAKDDFSAQLADVSQYNVVKYVTQSYADSGLESLVPPQGYAVITTAVRQKIDLIEKQLRASLADEARAANLLTSGPQYMTTQQRDAVREVGRKASSNILIHAEISRYCYENMNEKCLTFAAERSASIENYDPTILDIKVDKTLADNLKCEEARDWALAHGMITQKMHDLYESRNLAPVFEIVNGQRADIAAIGPCAQVADEL